MTDTPKPKLRAWKVMLKLAQAITFTAVEVIAAITLGGWLGVALWAIAAWNIALTITVVYGISLIAAERIEERP